MGAYTTTLEYDTLDRVVTIGYPDGERLTQTYNLRGLPDRLYNDTSEVLVAQTIYNTLKQIESIGLGNGLAMDYEYYTAAQKNNNLKRVHIPGLLDLSYTYDNVGNIGSIHDAVKNQTQHFTYDELDRLTQANTTGTAAGSYNQVCEYDKMGNITTLDDHTYIYSRAHPHAVTQVTHPQGTNQYVYDANGNMTQRLEVSNTQVTTYTQAFDIHNRLVAITMTNSISRAMSRFYYDGDGNRIIKVTDQGTTIYVGEHFEKFLPGQAFTLIPPQSEALTSTPNKTHARYILVKSIQKKFNAGSLYKARISSVFHKARVDIPDHQSPSHINRLMTAPVWSVEGSQENAHLGESVSSAGDVNNDTFPDIIVGMPDYDVVSGSVVLTDAGKVMVYYGTAAGPNPVPSWTLTGTQANAHLGWSVATAGDINGDGYDDVIIGAPDFVGSTGEGAVFVYTGTANGVSPTYDWLVEGVMTTTYRLGLSVNTAGDVNHDGYADVIIGSEGDFNQPYPGRADVFHGSETGLSEVSAWSFNAGQRSVNFGLSVSTAGDINGDTFDDVIVGSRDTKAVVPGFIGRADLFQGSTTGLNPYPQQTISSTELLVSVDSSLSVSNLGDINGDEYDDVILAGPLSFLGEFEEGKAVLYLGSALGLVQKSSWQFEGSQEYAHLGAAVGAAGDVNGDGYDDILVGAPGFTNGQTDEGCVFVFYGGTEGPRSVADWTIESNQAHARFGTAVNTAGHIFEGGNDAIIVGAPDYDGYQPDGGGVFAYVIDETPPILTVTHPISGEIIGSPQLFIRGKAQDHTSGMGTLAIHLLPRDILYLPSLGAHGAFTQPVGHQSLADGLNKLVITATDQALNKTVITQTLHLDVVGPRVTNLVPHGQISQTHPTIAANFDITGTASISLPTVIIEVDGQDVTLSSTLATNGFTYVPQQPLSEGNHNIHIHVADTASHQTQASGHFNVDRSTWVKVTYPLSNSILNTLTTTVQGYAETNATVALTVNGASAGEHQTTDGTFQFNTVNLVTATNYLTLSVTDGLGNSASTSWVVEVSLEHPSAYVTADPPTFSPIGCVDHTTFALEASVPEGEAIAAWHFQVLSHTEVITHRHGLHQPPASIRWDGEGWPEGAYLYTLTVTATNGATTTTPEQVVHIKTTAPAAPTILYPTSGTVTDRWQVWVAGEGEAESTITLLDGGYFTTTLTQTVGMNGQWGGYYPLHGGVNHIWAIASDATCLESPPSNAVTVTQLAHPPLYTVGVTPTTMAAGESVTLWATTRHHNPMEGAPTAHVWAWPPDGTTQSLTRTGVLDGGEVGLWTESWVVPSGQRSGDYPVFFEGLDTDNIRGQGETGLAVRNGVAAPRILGPAARHITNNPNVHLWGTVEEGYLYLNIFEHSDLLTSQALGPVLHWGVPLTLTGEGPHPLHARAQDRFGQLSPASNLVTITLDTLPPTAHVLPLPAWQGQTAFTVRWTGSDATAGVKSYDVQWWRDGMWHIWQQSTSHLSAPFTGEGGHTYAFRVRARDMVGNQSAWSAPVTTTLDTQAPTAHITSTLGKDDVISVVWHAEDAGAGLQACTVEARDSDGPWTPIATECTGQTTYAGEPGRMSRFRITATDNAGNAGAAQSQAGTPRVTKYYYHGGKRVAMRVAHDLYYLHGDHLGSTHLTTDKDGGLVSEQRYLPYGEVRWEAGTSPTDFGFTGQRAEAGTGLIFMHARYYLPAVGRFIQADSVIASPGNPQNLNRYTYVLNNPLRYIDPTGHIAEDPDEQKEAEGILSKLDTLYDVRIRKSWRYEVSGKWNPGNWTIEELRTVLQAVKDLAQAMGGAKAFRHELGGVRIMRAAMKKGGRGMPHLVLLDVDGFKRWTVLHELGHAWDAAHGWQLSKQMQREMGAGFSRPLLRWLHYNDPAYWYDPGKGPPPCGVDENFNAKEDFAESVAAWVDPAQGWISAHSASLHGPRWQKWPYKDPTRGYAYTGFREIPRGQFMGSLFATSRAKFYTHPTSSHNYR
jgi:RHS repeat-associated protein